MMHRASGQSYVGSLPASALPATSNASLSLAESLAGRYTSPQKLEKLEARINEKGGEVSIGFGGGSDSRQGSGNATSLQSGESKTLLLSQGSPSLPPRHTMPPQKGGKGVKGASASRKKRKRAPVRRRTGMAQKENKKTFTFSVDGKEVTDTSQLNTQTLGIDYRVGASSPDLRPSGGKRKSSSASKSAKSSASKQQRASSAGAESPGRTINSFFPTISSDATAVGALYEGQIESLQKSVKEKSGAVAKLEVTLKATQDENKRIRDQAGQLREQLNSKKVQVSGVLETLLRESDHAEALHTRKESSSRAFALGQVVIQRHGVGPQSVCREMWCDGQSMRDLKTEERECQEFRESLAQRRKRLRESRRESRNGGTVEADRLDNLAEEETINVKLALLKKRESRLEEKKAALNVEKIMHIRGLKRIRDEDNSRFNKRPILNDRYLLRCLLGKGGFSEVWKAFDLHELRNVAVKVHELNPNWGEHKKASYLRHATREYKIHLNLVHPRIVHLFDVFEIDNNSFATVLEFCGGYDLDHRLKLECNKEKGLPEKDARAILLQTLSGMRYLSTGGELNGESARSPCIIHYDLKPGNILFDDNGDVKITDFGLSKIMDSNDGDVTSMELTSQGAGTYWYLPPECFHVGGAPPKISSKVDVWSLGVIFFQMLYGKRPFGEGQTQDRILQNQVMLRAKEVEFPAKPAVSERAKTFIRTCLTYSQDLRPDMVALCEHPYTKK